MKYKTIYGTATGLLFMLILFSSCLKKNLPAYPLWDGNAINNVYIEYRYNSDQMYDGKPVAAYQRLSVEQIIDSAQSKITLNITVPAASGSFSSAIRDQVSQTKLWVYFDLSTAAIITPTGDTPKPGYSTDLTKPQSYIVTAANGQKHTWTIVVSSFKK